MNSLLTPRQVADRLGLKVGTIYAWVKEGRLPHIVLSQGNRKQCVRFHPDEIEAYVLKRHKNAR